jgi:hypothetical protein
MSQCEGFIVFNYYRLHLAGLSSSAVWFHQIDPRIANWWRRMSFSLSKPSFSRVPPNRIGSCGSHRLLQGDSYSPVQNVMTSELGIKQSV